MRNQAAGAVIANDMSLPSLPFRPAALIPPAQDRRLLVSIHDVSPAFTAPVEALAARLRTLLGGPRFAMLVVPNHWGRAPIAGDAAFARRLRGWADEGIEMFLHGWLHRDDSRHDGAAAAFKARHMTAGEGEFLGLSAAEAERRLRDGRDIVEQAIGRSVAGFIAPAWLYGDGAHQALAATGFTLAEDHWRVWRPHTGETVARGPVITWASRSPARTASSLAVAGVARTARRMVPVVRLAVHPGDMTKTSIVASIARTVRALAEVRQVVRYADLDREMRGEPDRKAA